jgi:hypothetical protein
VVGSSRFAAKPTLRWRRLRANTSESTAKVIGYGCARRRHPLARARLITPRDERRHNGSFRRALRDLTLMLVYGHRDALANLLDLAPEVGFEPTTNRLTADRSTTELLWIAIRSLERR